jgi:DNA repair ATPase RecN
VLQRQALSLDHVIELVVTIEYDGEGDGGQIDAIVAESAAGRPVKLLGKTTLELHGQPREYKTLEERNSRKLLSEFAGLRKRYWGQHLWARGYWVATSGNVTESQRRSRLLAATVRCLADCVFARPALCPHKARLR